MKNHRGIWAAGLAIFAMFFGSGNLVFPLNVGIQSLQQTPFALIGLFCSAIIVPFLGVLCMITLDGDHNRFFQWFGKFPKLLFCTAVIALIGPFGVLPRCLTIAYASLKTFIPINVWVFGALCAGFIFYALLKKHRFINILGYILTPLLLGILSLIIVKGLWHESFPPSSSFTSMGALQFGLIEGYNTMDLLGAIFFTKTLMIYFENKRNMKEKIQSSLKAGSIGLSLLGIVYLSFALLGAFFGPMLQNVAPENILMTIALNVLGPVGGIFAAVAICLACLTTAMALAETSARFVQKDLCKNKISEKLALIGVLAISIVVSSFEFSGIAKFLTPILIYGYPAIIALTLLNLCKKIFGKFFFQKPIKS